jgi:hypothetical protein
MLDIKRISSPRGEVIGVGKFKVTAALIGGNVVPRLSFIVTQGPDSAFIATCIHLRLDGYGKTPDQAISDMIADAHYFLKENFTNPKCRDRGWENLEGLFKCDEQSSGLWNLYHAVQVEISRQGRTIDSIDTLYQMLEDLEVRVEKLEKDEEEARRLEEKILTIKEKIKETEEMDCVFISEPKAA